MSCLLCKSNKYISFQEGIRDFEYGTKGNYRWLKCSECELISIDPIPSNEILNAAYPSTYHAYVKPKSFLTQKLISLTKKYLAKRIASYMPKNASIIEIGCSTGALLEKIGYFGNYKLFGVEYMPEAAEEARAKGITVWQGALEHADIKPNSMDLAILQHTLEHVLNPVDTLKRIHDLLNMKGKVIGEVPNIASWDAYLFGKYWGGGHAPRHIWFFTPNTLKRMLEQCGFQDIKIRPSLHTGHWALSIQNFLRRKKYDCDDLIFGRAWYYPAFLIATIPPNIIQMLFLKTGVISFEAKRN